jgi:hypothetical protein
MRWIVENVWKHRVTGWTLFAVFMFWCGWWKWHIPSTGKAIAVLAVVAALMGALLENLSSLAKFAWIILLFGFVYVEMNAIDEDKRISTEVLISHFTNISKQADQNLRNILEDEHSNFTSVLETQQKHFALTNSRLLSQQQQQTREFSAILDRQQQLFEHEEQLAESLDGKLVPAAEPTPQSNCPTPRGDSVLLFLAEVSDRNTVLVTQFPRTVVAIKDVGPAITLDRSDDGSISVEMDIRSKDRRIIARLDKNGFVVNRNNFLEMRKDKSNLVVTDEYGAEVLNAHYLNRNAFVLKGVLTYPDRNPIPIKLGPRMSGVCLANAGSTDILFSP